MSREYFCSHFLKGFAYVSTLYEKVTKQTISHESRKIIIIFLHGLGRLTCSVIDALPSFPGASTNSSSSRFVVEGVFRKSGIVIDFVIQLECHKNEVNFIYKKLRWSFQLRTFDAYFTLSFVSYSSYNKKSLTHEQS
jgi:hypothetical protein